MSAESTEAILRTQERGRTEWLRKLTEWPRSSVGGQGMAQKNKSERLRNPVLLLQRNTQPGGGEKRREAKDAFLNKQEKV